MSVSRETHDKLKRYEALLKEWQEKMNLVSRHTLDSAWARHFEDSLQLLPLIPPHIKTLFDFGSGAGFPGLVMAISRPDITVHLVESIGKKCRFLEAVSRETSANAIVHQGRIESVSRETEAIPDMITARALANLTALLEYSAPWIAANPALILLFPKGVNWAQEVEEARKKWSFQLDTHKSVTDPEAMILAITNAKKA
jgi:16S rRNA (guanine527-N7)-methyltransferase